MLFIQYDHLTKELNNKQILNDVTFSLTDGICALLGPNGAGKSTLLNITVGLLRPNKGNIFVDGKNIITNRKNFSEHIGYMPQQETLYPDFTAEEYLQYLGLVKGENKANIGDRVEQLLKSVQLSDDKNKKIRYLSGGMKQRLRIAQAFIGQSDFVILDEPTAGLDPEQRVYIKNLLLELGREKIVVFATHVVADIESIADTILILNKGKVIVCKSREDLLKNMEGKVFEMTVEESEIKTIEEMYLVSEIRKGYQNYKVRILSNDNIGSSNLVRLVEPTVSDAYLWHINT